MRAIILSVLVGASFVAQAQDLKDPDTRDEDISNTQVTVKVSRDGAGLYYYVYSVASGAQNKGTISGLDIDLWCDLPVDPAGLPDPAGAEGHFGDLSFDGLHVAAVIRAAWGSAFSYGISSHNTADWGLGLKPGEQSSGLEIISPAPPGMRQYVLWPSMDTDGWAYTEDMEDNPDVPWIPDFVVFGQIQGPACGTPQELFLGTSNVSESPTINSLLAYSAPLQDRFHTTTAEVTLTIHYSNDIDPKHFHVEPANYRQYFHVTPGGVETVKLPLSKAKNRIKLEAQAINDPGSQRDKPEGENASRQDVDVFEIRVDGAVNKKVK